MQSSIVFNQVTWPGVGDVDDCWVLSSIQCVHTVAPWLHLVNSKTFRAAAGDPDDGQNDGGNLAEIVKGVEGAYPSFAGRLSKLRNINWSGFLAAAGTGRPLSLAVDSSKLPLGLQYGYKGYHQISAYQRAADKIMVANPLAKAQSRWTLLSSWEPLRAAIMGYGHAKAGSNGAWAVVFPTEAEMLPTHPLYVPVPADPAPYIKEGWNAAVDEANDLAVAAAAQIAALRKP